MFGSFKKYISLKITNLIVPILLPAVWSILDQYLLSCPKQNIDITRAARLISAVQSAQFFMERMPLAKNLRTQEDLLSFALENATIEGLCLEFGVWKGRTIKLIAKQAAQTVYGFDSFMGVDSEWTSDQDMRHFSLSGEIPNDLPTNVELVVGYFKDTLSTFITEHNQPVRFMHIDSDIYESARTILQNLYQNIVLGTIIVFDNYLNYPTWQQHEHKAFEEFTNKYNMGFKYIGFASHHHSVCIQIC